MSYVYIVTDDDIVENTEGYLTSTHYIKIGYTSNDVHSRISQLQTGNPRTLSLLYLFRFDGPETAKAIERLSHAKLKEFRTSGEWFQYNESVFKYLNILREIALETQTNTAPDEEAYRQFCLKYELAEVSNG